jgi:phage terminase small subunit
VARPKKSAAQKKAEGILRSRDKPQLEAEQALALSPLLSVSAPAWLPASLVPTWRAVTADLCKMGAIVPGDLVLLEQAFRMMGNTITIQALLDSVLSDDEGIEVAQVAKLSAALVAQEAAYERILGKFGITPSERARLLTSLPRPPKDDKKKGALDYVRGKL